MDAKQEERRFHQDWDIDFARKLIYRKKRPFWRMLSQIILKPKYPVLALYRFARQHEASSTGIVYPDIVDADMLPKIDGIPTRFVLKEPWRIAEHDLKTLFLGPLTQNTTILVPPFPQSGFFTTTWEVLRVLATLSGAIGFIFFLFKVIIYVLSIYA